MAVIFDPILGELRSDVGSGGGGGLPPVSSLNNVVDVNSNYTATIVGIMSTINVDVTSGNVTVTLPTAVGNIGYTYRIKSVAGNNVLTVAGNGSELIDGTNTIQITTEDAVTIVSNNVSWRIF